MSADGGPIEPASLLDRAQGENSHRWPVFLPDGVHFLYFARASVDARRGVYLGRLDRPASLPDAPLFQSESEVVYAPPLSGRGPGDLLYVRNGRIEARSFDADRIALVGDARTLDVRVGSPTPYHPSMLSASSDVLAFGSSPVPFGSRLASMGRNGDGLQIEKENETQNWPRLSPDGQRLARQRVDALQGNPDIWVDDLERGTRIRVTTAAEPELLPVWSPDGNRLAYFSGFLPGGPGPRTLSIAAADGTGILRSVPCPNLYCEPTDWSPDGRSLIVNVGTERGTDIWTVSTESGGTAQPLLADAYSERDARFSSDGRWIAYVSEESGRPEVSVRSISGPPIRHIISADGGDQPVWRRDGAELFFVDPRGRLRSTRVAWTADGVPTFGLPGELAVPPVGFGHFGTQYDVSPDGRRIYMMRRTEDLAPREINVVIGWRSLFK